MRKHPRIVISNSPVENLVQPSLTQLLEPRMLVHEERKFSNKADVGYCNFVPHKNGPFRRQRLFQPPGIDFERLSCSRVNAPIHRAVRQRKQIDLRVPRENKAYIQKTVDPRRLVGVTPVQRKGRFAHASNCPHDAVGLENPDLSIEPESSGHVAERLRFQEGICLEELRAGQPDAPGSCKG